MRGDGPEDLGRSSGEERAALASSDTVSFRDSFLGTTIDGRYVVERVLGEGSSGVVYLARHKIIDKRVAVKIMPAAMCGDAAAVTRFINEARAATNAGSPHIVEAMDSGRLKDGSIYYVMEHLDGEPLSALLSRHRVLEPRRLVHIAKQIAQGMIAAHAADIVHRDLKPDNVMLVARGAEKEFVKILDFGTAKIGDSRLTKAGIVLGTPRYMSPEQAFGNPVDGRSDVYSLGVILYEMASGRVPFDAEYDMSVVKKVLYDQPIPLAIVTKRSVPPALEAIIMKCLAKSPDARIQSMQDLVGALEDFEQGAVTATRDDVSAAQRPRAPSIVDALDKPGRVLPLTIAACLGIAVATLIAIAASRGKIGGAKTSSSAHAGSAVNSAIPAAPAVTKQR